MPRSGAPHSDAVRDLLHRYCLYVDGKCWAELAALFTPDAVLELSDRPVGVRTPEAIAGHIAGAIGDAESSHHCTTWMVDFSGADRARLTSAMFYLMSNAPGAAYGSYVLDARRLGSEWRIARLLRVRARTQVTP